MIECKVQVEEGEYSYLSKLKEKEAKQSQFVVASHTKLPPVEIPKPINQSWARQQKSDETFNSRAIKRNKMNSLILAPILSLLTIKTTTTTMKPTLMDVALELSIQEGLTAMRKFYGNLEWKLIENGEILQSNHPAALLSKFSAPSDELKNQEMAAYATLTAAKALRKNYDFGIDFARHAHNPKISLRRTALEALCPPRDAPFCDKAITERYRTFDGTCNNKEHPRFGAALMPFHRFLPPEYGDGVDSIRTAIDGGPLASSRFVSLVVHGARDDEAPLTLMLAQWGQLLDHDMTSTAQPRSLNGSIPRCCGSKDFHPFCFPIKVPLDDPWLSSLNIRCLEFLRSAPAQRRDCVLSWREQINQATSYIDASPIYSSGIRGAENSRLFHKGLLFFGSGSQAAKNDGVCAHGAIAPHCIRSGDGRSSEQPGLLALHHVWVGEHNRIALKLANLNRHWSDEKIYQETRRIISALFQHITFKEFLPIVLGREVLKLFDLEVLTSGYYENYDVNVNPTTANAFSAAAFRFGHSLVQSSYMRCDRSHNVINNNVSLHEEFQRGDIGSKGSLHRLLRGLANQRVLRRDEFITPELTNHLFQTPGFPFGLDLAAINIQRGRDHGLPAYTRWRVPCGLSPITDWHDFANVVEPESARRIKHAYRSVHDIDLFVGGIAERPVIGGLVGPTFACIIAQQFSNTRKGDRFWYENKDQPNSFTPAQLQSIRQVSLAQVICRAINGGTLQPHIFLPPNNSNNKRVQCGTGPLKEIDLKPWLERISTPTTSLPFIGNFIKEEVPDHVFNILPIENLVQNETLKISENIVLDKNKNKVGFSNRPTVTLFISSNVSKRPGVMHITSKKPINLTINGINDKLDFKQGDVISTSHKHNQKPVKNVDDKLNRVHSGLSNKKRKIIINNVQIELRNTLPDDKPTSKTILTEDNTLDNILNDISQNEQTSRTLTVKLSKDKVNTISLNQLKFFENSKEEFDPALITNITNFQPTLNLTLTTELASFNTKMTTRQMDNLTDVDSNNLNTETVNKNPNNPIIENTTFISKLTNVQSGLNCTNELSNQDNQCPRAIEVIISKKFTNTKPKIANELQDNIQQTTQQNDNRPENNTGYSSTGLFHELIKYDNTLRTKTENIANISKHSNTTTISSTENKSITLNLTQNNRKLIDSEQLPRTQTVDALSDNDTNTEVMQYKNNSEGLLLTDSENHRTIKNLSSIEVSKSETKQSTSNITKFYENKLIQSEQLLQTQVEDRRNKLNQMKIGDSMITENVQRQILRPDELLLLESDNYERTLNLTKRNTTNVLENGSKTFERPQDFTRLEKLHVTKTEDYENTSNGLKDITIKNTTGLQNNFTKFERLPPSEMGNGNNTLNEQTNEIMQTTENAIKTLEPTQLTRTKHQFLNETAVVETPINRAMNQSTSTLDLPKYNKYSENATTQLQSKTELLELREFAKSKKLIKTEIGKTKITSNSSQCGITKPLEHIIETFEINKTFTVDNTFHMISDNSRRELKLKKIKQSALQNYDKDIDPLEHHSESLDEYKRVTRKVNTLKNLGEVNKISVTGSPVRVSATLNRKLYNPLPQQQQQHATSSHFSNGLRQFPFKGPDFDDDVKYHPNPHKIIVNGDNNQYEIEINIKNKKPLEIITSSAPYKKRTTRYTAAQHNFLSAATEPSPEHKYYMPTSMPTISYPPSTTKPPTIIIINENDYHITMQRPDLDRWGSSSSVSSNGNIHPQFNHIVSSPYSVIATTTTTATSGSNNYPINTPISYNPIQSQAPQTLLNQGNYGVTSFTSTVGTQSTINVNVKPDNTQIYPFNHNVNGPDYHQHHQHHWQNRPITVNAPYSTRREEIMSNINIPYREHIPSPFSSGSNHNSYRQSPLASLSPLALSSQSSISQQILPELKEILSNVPNQKLSDIHYDYNDRSLQLKESLNSTDYIDDADVDVDVDDDNNSGDSFEDYFYDENITLPPKLRDIDKYKNKSTENFKLTETDLNTSSTILTRTTTTTANLSLSKTLFLNDNYVMPILNNDQYSSTEDTQQQHDNFTNFIDIFSRQLNSNNNNQNNNSNKDDNPSNILAFDDQATNDDNLTVTNDIAVLTKERNMEFTKELPKPIAVLNEQQQQQQQFWPFWHYNDNHEGIDKKISKYHSQSTADEFTDVK